MISDDSPSRWPNWRDVLEVWNRVLPPDVEIISFVIGQHRPDMPWFNRRAPYQTFASSPQDATAYHLCKVLSAVAPECLTAYKIYACCRERNAHRFTHSVIEPVFRAHGFGGRMWWTGGAKYLLPALSKFPILGATKDEEAQRAEWRSLVTDAAEHWTAVANEWALVRIPKFMDRSSAEYREWELFASAQDELHDRAVYERLKRKFEK